MVCCFYIHRMCTRWDSIRSRPAALARTAERAIHRAQQLDKEHHQRRIHRTGQQKQSVSRKLLGDHWQPDCRLIHKTSDNGTLAVALGRAEFDQEKCSTANTDKCEGKEGVIKPVNAHACGTACWKSWSFQKKRGCLRKSHGYWLWRYRFLRRLQSLYLTKP